MKQFADFADERKHLEGDKARIDDILNKEIIFTGSDVLIEQLEKYRHEIPFKTVIKKINRYYTLS